MTHKRIKNFYSWPDTPQEALFRHVPKIQFKWDYGGLKAKNEELIHIPVPHVHFTHTKGEECHTQEECVRSVLGMQKRDMEERGLDDIQYNFYIGSDGIIYEGRGWIVRPTKDPGFEHLEGISMDVAFIGDFTDKDPNKPAMKAAVKFVSYMVIHKWISDDYGLIPLKESHVKLLKMDAATIFKKNDPRKYVRKMRKKFKNLDVSKL